MNGLMIFETIDKEEDPEAARKDPREDLEKNIQLGEDKKVKKYLKHEFRKMKHFYRVSKEQVDRYSKFETVQKRIPYPTFKIGFSAPILQLIRFICFCPEQR